MSIIVSNTSVNYGGESTITVNNLINVTITPNDSVINTETNSGNNIIIFTVKPTTSTLYYIIGYNTFNNRINLNTTIYVNITLLNNIIEIPYNKSQELNVYGCVSYKWSPLLYLNNNDLSSVICTPLENIIYTIIGRDSFNTVSRTYLKIVVNNGLIFTQTNQNASIFSENNSEVNMSENNPTVYSGNLLNLSVYFNYENCDNFVRNSGNINNIPYNNNNIYEEDTTNNYIWTFVNGIPILSVTSDNIIASSANASASASMSATTSATMCNSTCNSSNELTTDESNITYVWKSKIFDTLPLNCIYYKYGTNIILHPYSTQEYNVTVYQNNNILTSGNIKINVIEKPMNVIDVDILPYILYETIIERDTKSLIILLNENKQLVTKIINFYYNTLQTAYRMEGTNKSGISFSIKWTTTYQIINESTEMILNFNQQWNFFKYINYNRERNNIITSNFSYLLNVINQIYLEYPQKIGIYPLLS
jgi:hypothetical protein